MGRYMLLPVLAVSLLSTTAGVSAEETGSPAANLPEGPDFKDVLSLSGLGGTVIAPDGSAIAYTVTTTDWEENRYDTEIHLARRGDEPLQLTRTGEESSTNPKFSPDSRQIAFLADRGDGRQIHLIRVAGGEALALTKIEGGVDDFEFSPDGQSILLTTSAPEGEDEEKRQELYGSFAVEDAEFKRSHLWLLDVERALDSGDGAELPEEEGEEEEGEGEGEGEGEETDPPALSRLTGGDDFTVDGFEISPDGKLVVFAHRPDTAITSFEESDLSILDLASGEIRPLVTRPGYDGDAIFSPDGAWVLFSTDDEELPYYKNNELAKVPTKGGDVVVLTGGFDEQPYSVAWLDDGVRFLAFQKTSRHLFRLDPETRAIERLTDAPRFIWSVDYTADGEQMVVDATEDGKMNEIYRGTSETFELERLTDRGGEVEGWPLGTREVVEWESRDGTMIEGVLWKGEGFDPAKRHPLLVVIHGGPAGISLPMLTASYVYPLQQWLAKGAMILMPNYRGSAGYGEAFRSLNVRNLGVGDSWDVLSGVDHLIEEVIADPERVGAMGWSQGGYISAFLTTTSDRFRAISVGAGISNWMTYYVNTDIHPFTRHYLQGDPWKDPEIYAKTSPMTYILEAKTPTLIQHGENDRRVPIPNAYELYQGLQDVGVETRLIVYKEFGHGISKPKERLAAMWHNWQWFARHIWGEEVELPLD